MDKPVCSRLFVIVLLLCIWMNGCLAQDCPDEPDFSPFQVLTFTQFYTGETEAIDPKITLYPEECDFDVTFECRMSTIGTINICDSSINSDRTNSYFDPQTGILTFSTTDTVNIQNPIDSPITILNWYVILETREVQLAFAAYRFENPCPTFIAISILEPDSFPDVTIQNILEDATQQLPWNIDTIAKIDGTNTYCGPFTVEFLDSDTVGGPLNTSIFNDARSADSSEHNFEILEQTNDSFVGSYNIYFTVSIPDYIGILAAASQPFQVQILDACVEPYGFIFPSDMQTELNYTITDGELRHPFPAITSDPFRCGVVEEWDLPNNRKKAVTIDTVAREIVVKYDKLNFEGEIIVTLTLTSKDAVVEKTDTVDFRINMLNPCPDTNFVWIDGVAPDDQRYVITTASEAAPFTFTHDPVSIATSPMAHTLCGTYETIAFFDGAQIDLASPVLQYDDLLRQFSIFSEDEGLAGLKPIVIESFLVNYPTNRAQLNFDIDIVSACEEPSIFTLTPAPQVNPDPYFYSLDSPLTFTFFEPSFFPSYCSVASYSCAMAASSPRTDLCSIVQGDSAGEFDTTALTFSFTSIDIDAFPEGVYSFEITTVASFLTVTDTIEATLINPCKTSGLELIDAISDQRFTFFQIVDTTFFYDVQGLARLQVSTDVDCGDYQIEFSDATTGNVIDGSLFDDGLSDADIVVENGAEVRQFTIYKTAEPELVDQQVSIAYKVSFADYPEVSASGSFKVSYVVSDKCDQRLVAEGLLEELSQACFETDEEQVVEEVVEEVVVEEEVEEPILVSRPIIEPFWLRNVHDQQVIFGGKNLIYNMGEALSHYGDEMLVEVDFGTLQQIGSAVRYDIDANSIIIQQAGLLASQIGYHRVNITASYEELDGETISFTETLYMQIQSQLNRIVQLVEDEEQTIQLVPTDAVEWDIITQEEAEVKAVQPGPMPFIKGTTWTGEVTVGWTDELQDLQDPELQLKDKVAIEQRNGDELDQGNSNDKNRLLTGNDRFLQDDRQINEVFTLEERKLVITDALQVSVQHEDEFDELNEIPISWQISNYDAYEMTVQINLDDINLAQSTSDKIVVITFWGTKYFKDKNQREVPFGTTIEWKIFRQAKPEESEKANTLFNSSIWLFLVLTCLFILVALFYGPLLPFWMFVNSLQLILHIPLINVYLPAVANLFMLEYLQVIRLHIGGLNSALEEMFGLDASNLRDYEAIHGDSPSFYNELIHACGYHVSLARNLILILSITFIVVAIWLIVALKDSFCYPGEKDKRKEHWWNNLLIRLLYEVFFEVVLCLAISYTATDFVGEIRNSDGVGAWGLTIGLTLVTLFGICLLIYLCFKNGPYVKDSYDRKSLKRSFWHYRSVNINQLLSMRGSVSDTKKPVLVGNAPAHISQSESESSSYVSSVSSIQKQNNYEVEQMLTPLPPPIPAFRPRHYKPQARAELQVQKSRVARIDLENGWILSQSNYSQHQDSESGRLMESSHIVDQNIINKNDLDPQDKDQVEESPLVNMSGERSNRWLLKSQNSSHRSQQQQALDNEQSFEGGESEERTFGQVFIEEPGSKYVVELARKAQLAVEAQIRVSLEGSVKTNPRYSTLFNGLKKNHPHNVALVHPMFFLARRIIFAAVIVLLYASPFFAALTLLLVNFGVMAFVICEKQWEASLINQQHIVNEVCLYLCLVLVFMLSGAKISTGFLADLGMILIGFMLFICAYNAIVIVVASLQFFKLYMKRMRVNVAMKDRRYVTKKKRPVKTLVKNQKYGSSHELESQYDGVERKEHGQPVDEPLTVEKLHALPLPIKQKDEDHNPSQREESKRSELPQFKLLSQRTLSEKLYQADQRSEQDAASVKKSGQRVVIVSNLSEKLSQKSSHKQEAFNLDNLEPVTIKNQADEAAQTTPKEQESYREPSKAPMDALVIAPEENPLDDLHQSSRHSQQSHYSYRMEPGLDQDENIIEKPDDSRHHLIEIDEIVRQVNGCKSQAPQKASDAELQMEQLFGDSKSLRGTIEKDEDVNDDSQHDGESVLTGARLTESSIVNDYRLDGEMEDKLMAMPELKSPAVSHRRQGAELPEIGLSYGVIDEKVADVKELLPALVAVKQPSANSREEVKSSKQPNMLIQKSEHYSQPKAIEVCVLQDAKQDQAEMRSKELSARQSLSQGKQQESGIEVSQPSKQLQDRDETPLVPPQVEQLPGVKLVVTNCTEESHLLLLEDPTKNIINDKADTNRQYELSQTTQDQAQLQLFTRSPNISQNNDDQEQQQQSAASASQSSSDAISVEDNFYHNADKRVNDLVQPKQHASAATTKDQRKEKVQHPPPPVIENRVVPLPEISTPTIMKMESVELMDKLLLQANKSNANNIHNDDDGSTRPEPGQKQSDEAHAKKKELAGKAAAAVADDQIVVLDSQVGVRLEPHDRPALVQEEEIEEDIVAKAEELLDEVKAGAGAGAGDVDRVPCFVPSMSDVDNKSQASSSNNGPVVESGKQERKRDAEYGQMVEKVIINHVTSKSDEEHKDDGRNQANQDRFITIKESWFDDANNRVTTPVVNKALPISQEKFAKTFFKQDQLQKSQQKQGQEEKMPFGLPLKTSDMNRTMHPMNDIKSPPHTEGINIEKASFQLHGQSTPQVQNEEKLSSPIPQKRSQSSNNDKPFVNLKKQTTLKTPVSQKKKAKQPTSSLQGVFPSMVATQANFNKNLLKKKTTFLKATAATKQPLQVTPVAVPKVTQPKPPLHTPVPTPDKLDQVVKSSKVGQPRPLRSKTITTTKRNSKVGQKAPLRSTSNKGPKPTNLKS